MFMGFILIPVSPQLDFWFLGTIFRHTHTYSSTNVGGVADDVSLLLIDISVTLHGGVVEAYSCAFMARILYEMNIQLQEIPYQKCE